MTYEEATKILKIFQTDDMMMLTSSDFDTAVELAIQAMELQVAKKPSHQRSLKIDWYYCPNCNSFVSSGRKRCTRCTQKLDWSEE